MDADVEVGHGAGFQAPETAVVLCCRHKGLAIQRRQLRRGDLGTDVQGSPGGVTRGQEKGAAQYS